MRSLSFVIRTTSFSTASKPMPRLPDVVEDHEIARSSSRASLACARARPRRALLRKRREPARFASGAPSVRAMSVVGSSSTVQPRSSFGPLAGERLGRRVVGDGGREQRDVDVRERNRRVEHRLGRRGRDHLDPVWGRDGKIGCQQDHLGAAAAGLLGERDPHPPRRAVADEADAVDRLACPTRRDQDAPTRQRAGCEQLLDASGDLVRLGQPPDPPLAFCHLALVGADRARLRARAAARRSRASRAAPTSAGSSPERRAPARDARAPPR